MSEKSDDEDLFDKEGISISNDEISTSSDHPKQNPNDDGKTLFARLDIRISQLEKQVKTSGIICVVLYHIIDLILSITL